MRKLTLVVHVSLDGYVASENGSFDKFAPGKDNLEFVCSLTTAADVFLAGRKTYQLLQAHWPTAYLQPKATADEITYSRWFNTAQKIVITKSLDDPEDSNTLFIKENIADEINNLKEKPGKDILMFGSPSTFQSLLSSGVVDACCMIVYPVIFGKGIPLFNESEKNFKLQLQANKQLANGEMALSYLMVK